MVASYIGWYVGRYTICSKVLHILALKQCLLYIFSNGLKKRFGRVAAEAAWRAYLVADMSELVSELSLFLSWTMLKSASLEKSVPAWLIRRADFRDSRRRTSSSFFFTSGPPFCKKRGREKVN